MPAVVQRALRFAATTTESSSGTYSLALAAQGRYEEALAAFNPEQTMSTGIACYYFYPAWDPVRMDPRFVKFLTDPGVKEAHDRAQAWRSMRMSTITITSAKDLR